MLVADRGHRMQHNTKKLKTSFKLFGMYYNLLYQIEVTKNIFSILYIDRFCPVIQAKARNLFSHILPFRRDKRKIKRSRAKKYLSRLFWSDQTHMQPHDNETNTSKGRK